MESSHLEFYKSLSSEEITLLTLRDQLYNGSWSALRQDLEHRLSGGSYIFKLVNRIEDDLNRIKKLQGYEEKHSVNLSDFAN